MDQALYDEFFRQRHLIERDRPTALLIDSPGGDATVAFKIARLFQRRAHDFVTVVPRYAKSAATLLALGGREIIMGEDAELGPLDVQIIDPERETLGSALDVVQSLGRLTAFSQDTLDQAMMFLLGRTGKRIDTLLPHTLEYVASLVKPLMEDIDVVAYTSMSRALKIASDYAVRLMQPHSRAEDVATALVQNYPSHAFVVDVAEAEKLGMPLSDQKPDLSQVADLTCRLLHQELSLVGLFGQKENDDAGTDNDTPSTACGEGDS